MSILTTSLFKRRKIVYLNCKKTQYRVPKLPKDAISCTLQRTSSDEANHLRKIVYFATFSDCEANHLSYEQARGC